MRWQAHLLLPGDHRVRETLGKQGLGDQRTIVGVTTNHIWAGVGQDFQCFVDRSSHDDSPYAPWVTRPRVVVHSTPSRSPPGAGHVSVDAISPHNPPRTVGVEVCKADEADCGTARRNDRHGFGGSGGAPLDAGEYDRPWEGSRKGAVKVA